MVSAGLRVVLMLGLVSLLGDFVYEGGRSVLPDYMRQLGMSAFLVGASLGLAELAGWVARPVGGLVADRTGRYSTLVKAGYGGLFIIPLIGLVSSWYVVVLLAFAERVFKGIRTPSRDAMLVRMRGEVGLGTAFGIHELMDQFGAAAGPLLAIAVLTLFNSTPLVFIAMAAPYAALLAAILLLPSYSEPSKAAAKTRVSRPILLYSAAVGLNCAGLLPLPLVLYMVSAAAGASSWLVPAAYTVAMVVDAVAGLILGRAFDKYGGIVVVSAFLLAVLPPFLIQSSVALLMVCALLVGVVVGAQESVFRAVVAQIAEKEGLGGAYGAYGLAIGVGSAAAGVVYGFLIEVNAPIMVVLAYAAFVQSAALAIFFNMLRRETVSK
ncbi:MAG: MFS transporter [Candidatus Caldarchaeum sp.]|nr:MFS transporter [Candidatus Caldarchaeum sp.]